MVNSIASGAAAKVFVSEEIKVSFTVVVLAPGPKASSMYPESTGLGDSSLLFTGKTADPEQSREEFRNYMYSRSGSVFETMVTSPMMAAR